MDNETRQRAEACLGEAGYDLREAVKLYAERHPPLGFTEISALSEIWADMDNEALDHLTNGGPSGHDFLPHAVERMTIAERFELHQTVHRGSEPPGHAHEMDPFSAGLADLLG